MTVLARLTPGTRFRVGTFEARLVCVTPSAATIEIDAEPREFTAHDRFGKPKRVRIRAPKRRLRVSANSEVEVVT